MFGIDVDYPMEPTIIGTMNKPTISSDHSAEKECRSCGEMKSLSSFGIHPGFPDGHRNQCKACVKQRNIKNGHTAKAIERIRKWAQENPERSIEAKKKWASENKDRRLVAVNRWRDRHPEYAVRRRELARKRYEANREKICAEVCAWAKANRHKVNPSRSKWDRAKRASDPTYRLKRNLRTLFFQHISGYRKHASVMTLLGCTLENFWIYLESRFQTGMTRQNYGKVWHIDHIIPCALFDLSKPEHQKICFHVSNLQPLFAEDNLRKGAKHKQTT